MQKLPIGIQDFRKLRSGGYLYVDKTEGIYRLSEEAGYYFLSRPRRFGKSLLVSTMKELFSGSKELFQGLWIENQWDWNTTNPVLHIPFSSIGYKSLGLERALHEFLDDVSREHDLGVEEEALEKKFSEVLERLSAKHSRVVLLIDEYDKPIIDYLGREIEQAKAHREVLKKFYSILKDSDPHLRLVFITGVSKFSKVSIFSDLNNLDDLTIQDYRSNTLLGYTQEELEHFFKEHIAQTAATRGISEEELLEQIKNWYNGYSWNGADFVYNPFSMLNFFQKRVFMNHWFKTATPTFLIDLLRKQEFYELDGMRVGDSMFDSFDLENLQLVALLFQTGYLTIKHYDYEHLLYTLGYPNFEVKKSMLEYLIDVFSKLPHPEVRAYVYEVADALRKKDLKKVEEVFNILLRSLPYQLYEERERLYHIIIHLFFKYMALDVHSEVNTSRGRANALVELDDKVYCFEFKYNKSPEEALAQIKKKGYLEKYQSTGKELIAVGVNFSPEKREVEEFAVEML